MIDGAALITIVSDLVADAPRLSETFAVKANDPVAVGVPVIAPDAAVRLSPVGRLPELMDHVNGDVPPDSVSVCEYETVRSPPSSDAVVIDSAALIVTDMVLVGAAPAASVTLTVKLNVPAAVGVPLKTPAELKLKPPGTDPELTDHVSVPVPPVVAKVCEYTTPTSPTGSGEDVVIASAGLIVIENALLPVPPILSVT